MQSRARQRTAPIDPPTPPAAPLPSWRRPSERAQRAVAQSPMVNTCILAFDLETTGLDPVRDRITDIAVYDSVSGQHFCTLVNPGRVVYPKHIQDLTGISLEMVSESHVPGFAVAAELFKRCQRPMPAHWRFVDSLHIAQRYIPREGDGTWKLGSLVDRFQVEKLDAHRALNDAIMLGHVLNKLIETHNVNIQDFSFLLAGSQAGVRRAPPKAPPRPVSAVATPADVDAFAVDDDLDDDVDEDDASDEGGRAVRYNGSGSASQQARSPPARRYSDPATPAEVQIYDHVVPVPASDGMDERWADSISTFVPAASRLKPDDARLLRKLDATFGMEAFLRLYPTSFQQHTMWSPEVMADTHVTVKGIVLSVEELPRSAKSNVYHFRFELDTEYGPCMCQMARQSEQYIKLAASRMRMHLGRQRVIRGKVGFVKPFGKVVWVSSEGEEDTLQSSGVGLSASEEGEDSDTDAGDGVDSTLEITPLWTAVQDATGEKHKLSPARRRRILQAALAAAAEAEVARGDWVLAAMSRDEVNELRLLSGADALRRLHQPKSLQDLERARLRLAFEELLVLQLAVRNRRRQLLNDAKAVACNNSGMVEMARRDLAERDFVLTEAQQRVLTEVLADMARSTPMVRLVIGDTGCGKSIVAFLALLAAVDTGVQAALMAPTQILAQQHMVNLSALLDRMPPGQRPRIELVTNAKTAAADLKCGAIRIAVGTHALIQEDAEFSNLGLVIIDEEHRFGVDQRSVFLRRDTKLMPHVLTMSSTPIPRSLALCMYGEHNMSFINGKPPHIGAPVITEQRVYDTAGKVRNAVLEEVRAEIAKGGRAFLVYHKVQPQEATNGNSSVPARAAISAHAQLSAQGGLLAGIPVGLIHGKMKDDEKAAAMRAFASGATPVLVASKVVEVGVDVPEATLLVVEDADCFGLAELHQLRGRVGRGRRQGRCILLFDKTREKAKERMDILCRATDGLEIAEADLRMRGFGELLDSTQTGATRVLQLADPLKDAALGDKAREVATRLALLHRDAPMSKALQYALASRGMEDASKTN